MYNYESCQKTKISSNVIYEKRECLTCAAFFGPTKATIFCQKLHNIHTHTCKSQKKKFCPFLHLCIGSAKLDSLCKKGGCKVVLRIPIFEICTTFPPFHAISRKKNSFALYMYIFQKRGNHKNPAILCRSFGGQ